MENNQSSSSPLNPETFMRNWQQTGMRMLRAQERMLQGVASAAKLEMRFGQELMENRLALLKWTETDPQSRSNHAMQEVDKLVSLMRDVTEELRNGFTEAARMLAEASQEALAQSQETAKAGAQEASAILQKNVQAAQDNTKGVVQAGAELARQTAARTQRNLAKAGEAVKESVQQSADLNQDTVERAQGIVSEQK